MRVERWGRVPYRVAWDRQLEVLEQVQAGAEDTLVLVEHPPVLTLGASFHKENLLLSLEEYAARGIEIHETDRGGDVTYHGPNQLVIYPIFDLGRHGRDLHRWLRGLEETMIVTSREFGLAAERFPPNTGAWVNGRKIAAIGIKVRRWVSLHGIALNCDLDLTVFDTFVPCGIHGHGVTSLSEETGRNVGINDAAPVVVAAFSEVFGSTPRESAPGSG
ncbi:MAG: lipoyl(octanoyl) transferase LipB [Methanoregulaceae archaeon]|nr:lipoyl(octanoyl) transferase LipB [Methanoregulaceae archaeon]